MSRSISGRSPDALAEQTREALALLGFRSSNEPYKVRVTSTSWFDYGLFVGTDPRDAYSIWVCCFPYSNDNLIMAIDVKLMVRYWAYPDEPPQERERFPVVEGVTGNVLDAVARFTEKMRLQQCRHIR